MNQNFVAVFSENVEITPPCDPNFFQKIVFPEIYTCYEKNLLYNSLFLSEIYSKICDENEKWIADEVKMLNWWWMFHPSARGR